MDKAAKKGLIKKNTASRYKARLSAASKRGAAEKSRALFQDRLTAAGYGRITTEIAKLYVGQDELVLGALVAVGRQAPRRQGEVGPALSEPAR